MSVPASYVAAWHHNHSGGTYVYIRVVQCTSGEIMGTALGTLSNRLAEVRSYLATVHVCTILLAIYIAADRL